MITLRLLSIALLAIAASCAPQPAQPRYQRVVMVHGFSQDDKAFNSLKNRLESHGIECFSPQLKPADGRGGLEKIATTLKQDIDQKFGESSEFALVAFSMGGLVSRYYLQELGAAQRCKTFITISTPHHGTNMAYTYPSKGATQMRPGSDFLQNLEKTEKNLGNIPIVSYRTPMDLVILPTTSSIWKRAENHSFKVPLHPWMLLSKNVLDDIEKRLIHPPNSTKSPKSPLTHAPQL